MNLLRRCLLFPIKLSLRLLQFAGLTLAVVLGVAAISLSALSTGWKRRRAWSVGRRLNQGMHNVAHLLQRAVQGLGRLLLVPVLLAVRLLAILGRVLIVGLGLTALAAYALSSGWKNRRERVENTRIIQEINKGANRMGKRIEALETILLDRAQVAHADMGGWR
jgi:hypothetical protein